ncbi:MAG: helix-turn-helix domain-containing protein [Pseudonocardiales bacterium]
MPRRCPRAVKEADECAALHAARPGTAAASRLQVHPNTVRYQLRRTGEANLQLDRPDKRLAMITTLAAIDEAY